jgi:hypothetical protein
MRAAIAVLACAAVACGFKVPITKKALTMTDLKSGRATVSIESFGSFSILVRVLQLPTAAASRPSTKLCT